MPEASIDKMVLIGAMQRHLKDHPEDIGDFILGLQAGTTMAIETLERRAGETRNALTAALLLIDNKRMNYSPEFKAALERQIANGIGMPGCNIERDFLDRRKKEPA